MATYYWVGGTGTWSGTSTTNWAASSGGAGGAGVPGSADDVVFDANSNVGTGTFTVTTSGTPLCRNFTAGSLDGAMTLTVSAALSVYGNFTAPATNFSVTSGTVALTFVGSGTQTITSNGVTLTAVTIQSTGTVTLADALSAGARSIIINSGTFDTAGYNVTALSITAASAPIGFCTINLNSSTVTLSGSFSIINSEWCALNAGTSSIIFTATSFSITCTGNTTFYNVSFTSTSSNFLPFFVTSSASTLTFNNLTFPTPIAEPFAVGIWINGSIKVNGTLTVPVGSTTATRVNRVSFYAFSPTATINAAALSGSLVNVDFKGITITGPTAPWSGTNLGDGGGNTGITGFASPRTIYWSQAAGGNWSDNAWASSSGGSPALANFPLPQDTIVFDNTGLNTSATVTVNLPFVMGSIDFSARSNAMTFSNSILSATCGSLILNSAITISGTSALYLGKNGTTTNITTAGKSIPFQLITTGSGNFTFTDNYTSTAALVLHSGNIDLNGKTFSIANIIKNYPNPASVALNGATVTATGTAPLNFQGQTNQITFTGNCTFNVSSATAKTISNNNLSDLSGFSIVNTGAGALTFANLKYTYPTTTTSANYGNLTTTVRPLTVNFTAGQTFGFVNFGITGTAGNLVTLQTTTAGTRAFISAPYQTINMSYNSIKDLYFEGGAYWIAETASGNVDGGNNFGISFSGGSGIPARYTRRKQKVIPGI